VASRSSRWLIALAHFYPNRIAAPCFPFPKTMLKLSRWRGALRRYDVGGGSFHRPPPTGSSRLNWVRVAPRRRRSRAGDRDSRAARPLVVAARLARPMYSQLSPNARSSAATNPPPGMPGRKTA
jgi:hypothetical protein